MNRHPPVPALLPRDSASARRSCLLAAAAGLLAVGCENPAAIRPTDVRSYTTPKETSVAATRPPDPAAPSRPPLQYEPPTGWTDRGGSGLRLATLGIGAAEDGHEVTVIQASGSLEANVARWLGQLDPAASPESLAERAAAALAAAETVDVAGTQATVVALGGAGEGSDQDPAGEMILAGVIPIDDTASLFVKFKGPAAVASRERENFTRFVSSIRWK
ncbi:MAG: hypothetical protein ACKOCX_04605 [Planctomycetota bacterium]